MFIFAQKSRMDPNTKKRNLINKYSREELKKKLDAETFSRKTVSFYKYVLLQNPHEMRDKLYALWDKLGCLGRIYLAHEGINAQMSVPDHNWELFISELYKLPEFTNVPIKTALEDDGKSFLKLTIKVRKQIVADGLDILDYDVTNVGKHLNAEEWNRKMDEGVNIVDMRNYYESEIGHFENAQLPRSDTFRDELPEVLELLKGKENEEILLYCTGGIRCEKTSAYLKHHGFKHVNQLLGGIIDYARQVQEFGLENKFKGKNFVFDERLGEKVSDEIVSHCHQCGGECDRHTNCKNVLCNLLFIQCKTCNTTHQGCCSSVCQQIYLAPDTDKQRQAELLGFTKKPRYYRKESCKLT